MFKIIDCQRSNLCMMNTPVFYNFGLVSGGREIKVAIELYFDGLLTAINRINGGRGGSPPPSYYNID